MFRVAIYARYSSDNQRDASIEDQIRVCRERAASLGWPVCTCYTDHAVSGASMMRPGIQALMDEALRGGFNVILSEALDRLSRDQADIATIYKRLQFAGVKLLTLAEGEVSDLHIGLKGTMNALFLKDLADKTRRGLRGRVEKGRSGGGNSYGYDVVHQYAVNGDPERGERTINVAEAQVVRRIFTDYAKGKSPRAIARALNEAGIKGPAGEDWGPSTIHGNRKRGTGIINNELYIGRLVWNRLRYVKDPDSGKRVSRLNPREVWVTQDVPELRIVDEELWSRVKERQGVYSFRSEEESKPWQKMRPRYLLSGLVKCGCCGGGYVQINKLRLGCANHKNKGTCDNSLTIYRHQLEANVLEGLQTHLMDPKLTEVFCDEYVRHMNELRRQHNARRDSYSAEIERLDREMDQHVKAIGEGVPASKVKDRMWAIEYRVKELQGFLAEKGEAKVLFHPEMAASYRRKIGELRQLLDSDDDKWEAMDIIRSLIDSISLVPTQVNGTEKLSIDLHGDLAGILKFANKGEKNSKLLDDVLESIVLVAGACNTAHLLCRSMFAVSR